jgi:pyruvate,orthophosphate dikinase
MTFGAGSRHVHAAHRHTALLLDGSANEAAMAVVGGKGRAVAAMAGMGLPVPPAFCVTSTWCDECVQDPASTVERMWQDVLGGLKLLEERTGATFGIGPRPLLLSVRSSGETSMPGMLETVLNVGVDDVVVAALAQRYSPAFAEDVRDRFRRGYRRAVPAAARVPSEPLLQLRGALEAVVASWSSSRASAYRTHRGLDRGGIAILLQTMVFGNLDERSGTGVLFTRDPAAGASTPFGEWLPAAQGDDVVSGTSDCLPLAAMRERLPDVHDRLLDAGRLLERRGADVQDVEFTVEAGTLWLLQSRVARRSPQAAVRLALAFRDEGVIDDVEMIDRVTPEQLDLVLSARSTGSAGPALATGVPACPGVASGLVCTTSDDAIAAADEGRSVILVRPTTSPDDVAGLVAASGVVTETGGASSHAAIVARELGIPAVVGCGSGLVARLAGRTVTVDGAAGEVRDGMAAAAEPVDDPDVARFTEIAGRVRGR